MRKVVASQVLIPALTLLVVAGALVLIWNQRNRVERQMLELRTRTTTEQVALRLETFISSRLHLVRQMAAQWQRDEVNTPERFGEMARAIQAEFSSFQAINWIDPDGVIRWLVPEEPNLPARNRALQAHPGLADVLREAARRNEPRSSRPLNLFQGGRGFGTYFPLIVDGRLEGYINGVFRMDALIRDALQKGALGDFYLRIEDQGELLFEQGPSEVFHESPFAQSYPVHVLDRKWTLTLVPTPRTVAAHQSRVDEAFLAVGLTLAAGLAVVLRAFLQRQTALRESEQRLRLAVENMPAMVAAFDGDGQIIVWNRYCEQVTGFSSREIVGNPLARQLLAPEFIGGDGGGDSPLFGLAPGAEQEWILHCKKGEPRTISWSNASADLQVPGWAAWGVGMDITERRKTEDALRLTQFAMDHSAVATFWVREDGSFFYVNEEACRSLGYTKQELLGMGVFDIDPCFSRNHWTEHWNSLNRTGRTVTFESQHRRRDGSTFPVEITASPLHYKGMFYQFAFATDLTARKRAEEDRLAMERALLETQRLESLGVLAGGVAHDFNNLLTAVMGSASLARSAVGADSPVGEYLAHIESAAQQAADLARQLLAYSGKGKFVLTTFDLRSAVQETDSLLRVSIGKSVKLDVELGAVPLYVRGDPGQVRQIVMNLVINAAEAVGEEPGAVSVRTSEIELSGGPVSGQVSEGSLAAGRYVCLEVRDTGPGMDEQTKSRIFEPFFSTKATGRGLGLAAVLGIVRGHRGALSVDTAPGRGTTFRVFLPLSPQPTPDEVVEQMSDAAPSMSGGTVLVVDDEESVRTVARIILEDSGFNVLTAADGYEGVELFRDHADEVRVVLLDMTMPRMSGREALAAMRQLRPEVRVLLSSGFDEQEATGELAENRFTGFMHKPYRADQLLRKVREMMK
ncbi:MAG TPA: PAS domain S-box protein [Phycisphaerae bacterium]|nr:PAS domain S-box protein [Phycisphaerae bacterium]HPU27752.1 PAS domain S-box protein [Phycisphaerae bacterium]HPZ99131.1 PAS domain S-box protein [Phycisphaerae bacterium]